MYLEFEYLTGEAGTEVLFDSNVWLAASPNIDGSTRKTLTLAYSCPFVKPQINFCRLVGDKFSNNSQVMEGIGFRSIIPQSHEEWHQLMSNRFYYKDQG